MRHSNKRVFSTRIPWPTTAGKDPLTDPRQLRIHLDQHLPTLDTEQLDHAAFIFDGVTLLELGQATIEGSRGREEADTFAHLVSDDPAESARAVGLAVLADELEVAVKTVLIELTEHRAEMEFDGTQWWVTQHAVDDCDGYPQELHEINMLEESLFGTTQVGGGEIVAVPLLAAVSAVADDFASAALSALREAGIEPDALTAAQAALTDRARQIGTITTTMQRVMAQMTTGRPSPFEE